MITVVLEHPRDLDRHIERCNNIEVAYCVIGAMVIRGWTFVSLTVGE
jgi:hypothetical protein